MIFLFKSKLMKRKYFADNDSNFHPLILAKEILIHHHLYAGSIYESAAKL